MEKTKEKSKDSVPSAHTRKLQGGKKKTSGELSNSVEIDCDTKEITEYTRQERKKGKTLDRKGGKRL